MLLTTVNPLCTNGILHSVIVKIGWSIIYIVFLSLMIHYALALMECRIMQHFI